MKKALAMIACVVISIVLIIGITDAGNAVPAPYWRSPQSGAATTDHQIPFGWTYVENAESYWLQVDNDPNFGSPEIDIQLPEVVYKPEAPLADDTYYWRVKAIDGISAESAWSEVAQIKIFTPDGSNPNPDPDLGIASQLQHKDTEMLCLEGCSQTGDHAWDAEHTTRGCAHDNMYCCRAAISMIASYFGGSLSQDRISYQAYSGDAPGPDDDLKHGVGLWPHHNNVFSWALNGAAITQQMGRPTWAQITQWIDANRPILAVIPSGGGALHCVVIDGYTEIWLIITTIRLIHVIDPWTNSESTFNYDSYNFERVYVPPAGATARSDEASLSQDSDGDGIVDFDETERFGTDPNDSNTDDDCLPDKIEIQSYVFGNSPLKGPDTDGDGLRAERDPDSDNGGVLDGCEDKNANGIVDPGETDPFDPSDDDTVQNLVNAGFETGDLTGWTKGTVTDFVGVVGADQFVSPHGDYMLRLGKVYTSNQQNQNPGPNEVYQIFKACKPELTFAYNICTYDYTGFDDFRYTVRVENGGGEVIYHYQQGAWGPGGDISFKTTGWRAISIDISDYLCQELRLYISAGGTSDWLYPFWVYIDDKPGGVGAQLANVQVYKWGWNWVSPGQTMTYGLRYENAGLGEAKNVKIIDTLPSQVNYVWSTGGSYNSATRQVTWDLSTLQGSSGPQYVSISVYVPWGLAQGTVLHDTVTISTTSEETTVADNTSTWNTTVWTAWDPNNKLVGPEGDVTPGETLNYTVNYENEGLGIAFGVYITDTLDIDLDDTTLVIGSGGTYNPATRTITWDIGEVGPGEEGSVAFSANVRNDAPLGTIINNFATIYFPSVPQETNTNMVSNMVPIPPANLRTVDYNFGDPEPGFNMDNFPIYRYWMVVKVENAGQGDAFNVKATISSKPDSAMIIDGNVYIGNIPAGGSVWSTDTYTIELDLSQPGPGADQGITWTIEYDDMGGWHHVIEDVPEFPPASPSIAQRPPAWFIVINQPKLYQCYPNPFNPDTWIPYQLSKDSEVTIRIYNISGQLVKMLDLGYQPRGFYISKDKAAYWNGRNEFGEKVSSGVYFYHIQADKFNGIKKMVILK